MSRDAGIPKLGVGIGYREELGELIDDSSLVQWIEVITEQYLGRPEKIQDLIKIAKGRPIVPHGIEMSIGTFGNDDQWLAYVEDLAELVEYVNAPWFSDHLCFTKTSSVELAALIPLPRSREAADHVIGRARKVQEIVGRPFLLENIAFHFDWGSDYSEAEFLQRITEEADCHILLDLTNLEYNARNHGFSAEEYLDVIPLERVVQVHLAGGVEGNGVWYDTHSQKVSDRVWQLFRELTRKRNLPAAMLERDMRLDEVDEIVGDLAMAQEILSEG